MARRSKTAAAAGIAACTAAWWAMAQAPGAVSAAPDAAAAPATGTPAADRFAARREERRRQLARLRDGRPFAEMSDAELDALIRRSKSVEPESGKRLAWLSQFFLGTPYRFSPLGEGPGATEDPDPLWNVAETDCLAMVETLLALNSASSLADAKARITRIRYVNGEVGYRTRNHFMESEWIPNNLARRHVRDITAWLGGERVVMAEKLYTPELWNGRRQGKAMALAAADVPMGTFAVPIVPSEKLSDVVENIPPGTIANIVRHNFNTSPSRISHTGVVVWREGVHYFRHAAQVGWHMVVDEPLLDYVARVSGYKKWPVVGVNFLYPLTPEDLAPPKTAAARVAEPGGIKGE